MTTFEPTRQAALKRLAEFAPRAGKDYARLRNFDLPGHPHVSGLSPYLSHRILTEEEVLREILKHHSPTAAEKFIQEVCWRTYWKGVLERRPSIWTQYLCDLHRAKADIEATPGLRAEYDAAITGSTGIDAFDFWANQLVDTGYLHNHARMWFASIWIFTLRLPWTLGADFFMRHLLDADAASNTLSWRWVAGLQTAGKTYLARPDNIAKYTQNRFNPKGLTGFAAPLDDPNLPPLGPVPVSDDGPVDALLMTIDDLSTDALPKGDFPIAILQPNEGSVVSELKRDFEAGLVQDRLSNLRKVNKDLAVISTADDMLHWAKSNAISRVAMNHLTTGPTLDIFKRWLPVCKENGMSFHRIVRTYDTIGWSAATAGFFKFKAVIPRLLSQLNQPVLL